MFFDFPVEGRRFFFFRNVGNEFANYTCGRAFEQAHNI